MERRNELIAFGILVITVAVFILVAVFFLIKALDEGPGYLITSAALIISAAFIIVYSIWLWRNHHYRCPSCSAVFKPDFIRSTTSGNDYFIRARYMRCPNCGKDQLMKMVRDKKGKEI